MGFSDTMAGFGRALMGGFESVGGFVGGLVEDIMPVVGPAAAQIGVDWLRQQAGVPRQISYSMPGGYQRTPFESVIEQYRGTIPWQQATPQPMPLPLGPAARNGGYAMPAFPSQSSQYLRASPAVGQSIPIPFTGYEIQPDIPFIDIARRQPAAGAGGVPTSPWSQAMTTTRAQAFVAVNPTTGRPTWFKPAGRPILWSGDLTACKRVQRIARRAKRSR